ncbi:MAG TPA: hypothetical protein VGB42_07830 [Candidatus Thermoplasmatota archaeon]
MQELSPEAALYEGQRRMEDDDGAVVIGPIEVDSVEDTDDSLERVVCDCGRGNMESFQVRKTRTKRVPRRHFERHFFRCGECGSEKVIWLDVTERRKVLGV